jgi:precorrin-6A/cobalt-precorrin-6A reductase
VSVLLLGGTGEARELALALARDGEEFVSSLAGRVQRPRLPVGEVRLGGFGGVDGLVAYLAEEGVSAVVDATHPFAAGISENAVEACGRSDVPLLRLARPGWRDHPDAGRWHWVDGHDVAATTASRLAGGSTVLLTTGRNSLDRFVGPLAGDRVVARVVDPVAGPLPGGWEVLLDRGPYTPERERALMLEREVGVLVTKDSGGEATRAKLDVAGERGVAVVVVRRPGEHPDVASVSDVDGAVRWLRSRRG